MSAEITFFLHYFNLRKAAATMSVYGFHQQLEVEMFCHLPHVHTLSVAVDTHMRLQKLEA